MARKTVKRKTSSTRKKTTSSRAKFVKLSATEMKKVAAKYSRSRDKRKARGALLKKYGKTQMAKISAMAKAMEKKATAKTTSARKKTTSARKKTTSARKTTSKKTTTKKKSKGRVAQGNRLKKLMTARAKAEYKKRGKALVAAYKKSAYAKSPTRKNWNNFVKKCGNVILAGMVKKVATK